MDTWQWIYPSLKSHLSTPPSSRLSPSRPPRRPPPTSMMTAAVSSSPLSMPASSTTGVSTPTRNSKVRAKSSVNLRKILEERRSWPATCLSLPSPPRPPSRRSSSTPAGRRPSCSWAGWRTSLSELALPRWAATIFHLKLLRVQLWKCRFSTTRHLLTTTRASPTSSPSHLRLMTASLLQSGLCPSWKCPQTPSPPQSIVILAESFLRP